MALDTTGTRDTKDTKDTISYIFTYPLSGAALWPPHAGGYVRRPLRLEQRV